MKTHTLSSTVNGNSPVEAINASPFQVGQMWQIKEVNVRISQFPTAIKEAEWIVEAELEPLESNNLPVKGDE
jgi:hypothetical protein